MAGKTLNVGLIGSGFMGQAHADAWRRAGLLYRKFRRCNPFCIRWQMSRPHWPKKRLGRYGFQHSTADWQSLVNNPEIDIVDITTPNSMHDMALAAIRAGKRLLRKISPFVAGSANPDPGS
ncbi:Gfo/Idh/MocA family oxidoreductase (plasmid) [Pseudomonas silvicola]|nr:Gfo/Idh/MocA family oxidoreductase [Pseudomonas silvicola]